MLDFIKKKLGKPSEEEMKKLSEEMKENEKHRQELYRRLQAVEVQLPIKRGGGRNANRD